MFLCDLVFGFCDGRYSESLHAFLCFGGMYHFVSGGNLALQIVIVGALRTAFIFAPFVAFQTYGYYNMCVERSPDEIRPWCKARIPLLHNYIQSHYWFLEIFSAETVAKLSTCISNTVSGTSLRVVHYAKSRPQNFFSLGFLTPMEEESRGVVFLSDELSRLYNKALYLVIATITLLTPAPEHSNLRRRKNVSKGDIANVPMESEPAAIWPGYLSASVLPFVLHLGFMVSTRFLSASPPLYWFASYIMANLYWFASYIMANPAKYFRWGYVIWAYSMAYIFLGSLLFSNFYPFTYREER
ncbi:hypothetical protein D0Y65_052856 [Glycine soja]|uniref:GPI mannosyltransferase 2 n=1 Tax=Glycine soja TaxID=3848 RepID=A0A445EZQ0_GLYSO|nr:hypothetical protein D0Y65_052856 [Glycine soja]